MNIPSFIQEIIQTISDNNHKVYIVGGAVRDSIMESETGDYDLTSSATPEQIINLFPKTIDVGKKYGTIIIIKGKHQIEVTTLRKESGYKDYRHPDEVIFCNDIKEDLKRRDFTVNAIAYDPINDEFVDIFGGQEDISNRLIKCVGNPKERIKEDSLRIFRAARFCSVLEFEIDPQTEKGISQACMNIALPAHERIRIELIKLLDGPNYKEGLRHLMSWKILDKLIPSKDLELTIENLPQDYDVYQKIAYLLKYIDKKRLSKVLAALCFSRIEKKKIKSLIDNDFDYQKASLTVKDLELSGNELIQMGITGKKIGKIQKELLKEVKSGKIKNKKKVLLAKIKASQNTNL